MRVLLRPGDRTETVASRAWQGDRRAGAWRRLDAPAVPAVVAAMGVAVFVLLRLAVVAKGDVTRFVMARSDFVGRARAPAGASTCSPGPATTPFTCCPRWLRGC
ncbi:MAG: hypothetical protein M0020_09760 [Actinomycetota bacterium]|nr:hypothetical protein [Actinomycetota bacterium]